MKKLIALLFVLVLGISLCACGNNSNNSGKVCPFATCENTDLNSKGYCSTHACPECGDAWDTLLQYASHPQYREMCSKCLVTEYEDDIRRDAEFCFELSKKYEVSNRLWVFFDNTSPFEFENVKLTYTITDSIGEGTNITETISLSSVSAFETDLNDPNERNMGYIYDVDPKYCHLDKLTITFDSISFDPYC